MRKMSVSEFVTLMKDELDQFQEAYEANQNLNIEQFPPEAEFSVFYFEELPIFMDGSENLWSKNHE